MNSEVYSKTSRGTSVKLELLIIQRTTRVITFFSYPRFINIRYQLRQKQFISFVGGSSWRSKFFERLIPLLPVINASNTDYERAICSVSCIVSRSPRTRSFTWKREERNNRYERDALSFFTYAFTRSWILACRIPACRRADVPRGRCSNFPRDTSNRFISRWRSITLCPSEPRLS